MRLLAKLAESGELKPVIDRRYPFESMADALRYVDTGRKTGSVVITLDALHGASLQRAPDDAPSARARRLKGRREEGTNSE